MATVYRKTPKGIQEIETRAFRLTPRLRSALILVDGRRSDADLRKLVTVGFDEAIDVLVQQGFIEPSGDVPTPRPAAAAASPVPAAPAAPAAPDLRPPVASAGTAGDFAALRRDAVKALNDLLGPMAESLAIRMERARSGAELAPLLETAESLIASARGPAAAADYRGRFRAR